MRCKDFDICGSEHDDRYTMDFTDVKPGAYIYWCSKCGPAMHKINDLLEIRLKDQDFAKVFETEVNKRTTYSS